MKYDCIKKETKLKMKIHKFWFTFTRFFVVQLDFKCSIIQLFPVFYNIIVITRIKCNTHSIILTRSVLYIHFWQPRLFGLMGSDLPFFTCVCLLTILCLTGYKNTKMMGREWERERFICLLFLICAHTAQKQINLSKQKATKKTQRRSSRRNSWSSWWKEKRTFNVDYVRHKTKQTFRLSCDDETKVENMQNMQKSFALLSIFIPCQRVYTFNRKSLKLVENRTTIGRK